MIPELVEKLEAMGPPGEDARALVREILTLHRAAVTRLAGEVPRTKLEELRADPAIAAVLEIHDVVTGSDLLPAANLLKNVQSAAPSAVHSCDFCDGTAAAGHAHMLDRELRMPKCACKACALVLADSPRFLRIPTTRREVKTLDDAWWNALELPVGVACLVRRGSGAVAIYPSPAGSVEAPIAPLALDAAPLQAATAPLDLAPDVEALVVARTAFMKEHWIVGIDRAYELVGRLRGSRSVHRDLERFFTELRAS